MFECIHWQSDIDRFGYGTLYLRAADAKPLGVEPGMYYAHRLTWQLRNGPIPDGLVIDHVCHTMDTNCKERNGCPHRRCVNPDHLEAVSVAENILRGRYPDIGLLNRQKTHCPRGHEYSPENIYFRRDGRQRVCKECRHIAAGHKRHWAKAKDHCVNGHPWIKADTYTNPKGRRVCRACKRVRAAAYREASSK